MSRRRRFATVVIALMSLSMLIPTPTVAFPTVSATVIQSGLVIPWDVAFAPTGQMFVSERPGRIRVYRSGATGAALLATTTISAVRAQGESGVMGIATHRNFAENRFLYVCASRNYNGQWLNQVLRYRVRANWTLAFDRYIIRLGMRANVIHNGCAVEHGPDGRIWISMGDANLPGRAQDPDLLNGKILRVAPNGAIPPGNPKWGRQPAVARVLHRPSQSAGDRIRARDRARVRGRARSRPGRRDQLDPGGPQLRVAVCHGDEQLVQPRDARVPRRHQRLRPARVVERGSDARDVERRLPEDRQVGHVAGALVVSTLKEQRPSPLQLRGGSERRTAADDDVQRDLGPPASDRLGPGISAVRDDLERQQRPGHPPHAVVLAPSTPAAIRQGMSPMPLPGRTQ